MYALLNDILGKVVKLDAMGISLDEAINGYMSQRTSRDIGLASVPERLWYETAEASLKADRKGTVTRFGESGEWIGKYILATSQPNNRTKHLVQCLTPLASNAREFSIEGEETMHLRFVDPRLSPPYTEAFSRLLTGTVEAAEYKCENRTSSSGMILLEFSKQGKAGDRKGREPFA